MRSRSDGVSSRPGTESKNSTQQFRSRIDNPFDGRQHVLCQSRMEKTVRIQINIGDHVSPEVGFVPIPAGHRAATRWARTHAKRIAQTRRGADTYFRTMPGGRSLTDLLKDSSIWVNYYAAGRNYGEAGGNEIGISPLSYRIGRWTVLGTLIHELAHVNGAPGRPSKQAEEALLHCGLGKRSEQRTGVDDPSTPYNPGISG